MTRKAKASLSRKLFSAGVGPAAGYGAQIWGFNNTELRDVSRMVLAGFPPRNPTASILGKRIAHDDPVFRHAFGPVIQWHRALFFAVWEPARAPLSLNELREQWNAAVFKARNNWRTCRGPVNACVPTLKRCRWKPCGPCSWEDQHGMPFDLPLLSPALFIKKLKQASMEALVARHNPDLVIGTHANGDTLTSLVARSKALPPHSKACLASMAANSLWTADRLHASGMRDSSECNVCGQPDSFLHRVFHCTGIAHVRRKLPRELLFHYAEVAASQPLVHRGVCVLPRADRLMAPPLPPPPRKRDYKLSPSVLFVDGSAERAYAASDVRAAWALVEVIASGEVNSFAGPVPPPLPQTSQAAEHFALVQAHKYASPYDFIYSDCAGAIKASIGAKEFCLHTKHAYFPLWRSSINDPSFRTVRTVRKVKAHQIMEQISCSIGKLLAAGNEKADELANVARVCCYPVTDSTVERARILKIWKGLLKFMAEVFTQATLPTPPEAAGRRRVPPPAVVPLVPDPPIVPSSAHTWVRRGPVSFCSVCWVAAFSPAAVDSSCRGLSSVALQMVNCGSNHSVAAVPMDDGEDPMYFCFRCGAYAQARPRSLLLPCPGVPSSSGRRVLKCLARGIHPNKNTTLTCDIALLRELVSGAIAVGGHLRRR